mmetsp:Transcript_31117/g.41219  ORF Transcript_31117/g.41219 Transcript_31117/m.41219 type:complete len:90 (+) Transcript_31117:744-1013(+)|eukprot:CAMPEP_0185570416 /NCGR_PEP_ID=MMETSP0434-20130131/2739_1 /TAXON_ID=626734 ORGANISM="Favella taraikaensis, Strain Fe Narragansett Bay" /NCGR_SAMPLE_ID=MMETSP0434 /ASSEMBLY_ACC=CAM_ASM_000379 /LENGTH=89 /DNA_ID=CAMNT_0028185533 /DNA_START=644 /DNA_END=913 /DNA_ORIENTATION=-
MGNLVSPHLADFLEGQDAARTSSDHQSDADQAANRNGLDGKSYPFELPEDDRGLLFQIEQDDLDESTEFLPLNTVIPKSGHQSTRNLSA